MKDDLISLLVGFGLGLCLVVLVGLSMLDDY